MKRFMYSWTALAAALLITISSCNPKATEDELNDFRALAEANDDSLRDDIASLQDSIQMAQNKQFAIGNLSGTFADSDTPFNVDFDFRVNDALRNFFDLEFNNNDVGRTEGQQRILYASFTINRTESNGGIARRNPSEDYLYFNIGYDVDAGTLAYIDYIEGQISQVLSENQNFVYRFGFSDSNDGDFIINNFDYDEDTEILSFDYDFSWEDGANIGSDNNKAAQLAGSASVSVPKEVYQESDNAPIYRKK